MGISPPALAYLSGDPYWVPPILSQQRQFLDPERGAFFEIGEARYFLAYQDGRPVGRLSAHINRLHDTCHGPETGFFGFFESIPDHDVTAALFEAGGRLAAGTRQDSPGRTLEFRHLR